jgi:hypothetical protein
MAVKCPPTTPEYLSWSEPTITFDRADHLVKIPHPRHSAPVLEAQIGGYDMSKVFMDGRNDINLIFASML